jgi:hypothetical protein
MAENVGLRSSLCAALYYDASHFATYILSPCTRKHPFHAPSPVNPIVDSIWKRNPRLKIHLFPLCSYR